MRFSNKKWVIVFTALTFIILLSLAGITAIIDPYFHYHKPLEALAYPINNERYQNDGIVKHFNYDAIITGTSMTESFMTSEFDELFGVHSVKVPFSGASYKEVNMNLEAAVNHNEDIKVILRCLDSNIILSDADSMLYDEDSYPWYLYDDYLYNDVKYVFNKTVTYHSLEVVLYTVSGKETTSFDDAYNWLHAFGKEVVDEAYTRKGEKKEVIMAVTEEDYKTISDNIGRNVTALVEEHPEIEFYFFFPPYSIYYWDDLNQKGTLERQLEIEKYAIELLLQYGNIHLFSFSTEYEMICNLDNYRDMEHYREEINSQMLRWMQEGAHELTWQNYEEYCKQMREFYLNYDYDALFDMD